MAKSNAARRAGPGGPAPLKGEAGGRAAPALDKLIHKRLRAAHGSPPGANDAPTFSQLQAAPKTSRRNPSRHPRQLEDAGYIACRKGFDGRVPRTDYRLTAAGRRALERYLDHMEALIRMARG